MNFLKKHLNSIVIILITIMVSCILIISFNNSSKSYEEAALRQVEDNINKAVVTCYSIEGFYPSNIDYLVDNYGLIINDNKVNVFYQALGSNIFPDIMVTYKGSQK